MEPSPTLLDLPARTAARWISLGHLAAASAAAERLRERPGGAAPHQLRSSLRRLRTVVRAFRPALDDTLTRGDRRRLRRLARQSSAAADAEIRLGCAHRLLADDPDARAACAPLLDALARERAGESPRLDRVLGRRFPPAARRLRKRLSRYRVSVGPAAPTPPETAASALGRALERGAGELGEQLAAWGDPGATGSARRTYVAVERLLHLLEPFAGELQEAPDLAHALGELEALLGALRELEDLDRWLSEREGGECLSERLRARRETLRHALGSWIDGAAPTSLSRLEQLAARLGAGDDHVEIERKFLLSALPPLPPECDELEVEQGWFGTRFPERLRRVRTRGEERCYRAIKHGAGVRRLELEEPVSPELFATLWPLTEGRRVRKRRYRVAEGELLWEIDLFSDRELVLAEVELPSPTHPVTPPRWLEPYLVREVTHEPAYLNLNLAC